MPTETDVRLRSWLDANQRGREQMCRSVLAVDPHYSDVRPRHPAGGPDGGRDIEAVHDGDRTAYGAIGFHNGANDSDEQKRRIRAKFTSDLDSALSAKPDLKAFAFLTNLHFTIGEQADMKDEARNRGIEHCDILDRERIRIELDSPSGFFIRFQFLEIPLSEAEQASFLSHYGDRIQEVVSTGFQRIERTLNRILFLQEASDVLDGVYVRFRLKKTYFAEEIGHFRAFAHISLREIKHDIMMILFGSSDRAGRFLSKDGTADSQNESAGIAKGISFGQWERQKNTATGTANEQKRVAPGWSRVAGGSSGGRDSVESIVTHYSHDDPLIRFRPRLQLRDLQDCMFMPTLNRSLAEKLHSIQVFANGYKLADIGPEAFIIDGSRYDSTVPGFTSEELADPWVRIRPSGGSSTFELAFDSTTPRRQSDHREMADTPSPEALPDE